MRRSPRRVTHRQATAAADNIADRRARHDGPGLGRMPSDLGTLVAFVHVYPAVARRDLAELAGEDHGVDDQELRRRDAADAFTIQTYLRAEWDRQQYALFGLARAAGANYGMIAGWLGKPDRRYAEDDHRRLDAVVRHNSPVRDGKVARVERAALRALERAARRHPVEIRALGAQLAVAWDAGLLPAELDQCGYTRTLLTDHLDRAAQGIPPVGMVAGLRTLVAALAGADLDPALIQAIDNWAGLLD